MARLSMRRAYVNLSKITRASNEVFFVFFMVQDMWSLLCGHTEVSAQRRSSAVIHRSLNQTRQPKGLKPVPTKTLNQKLWPDNLM